MNTNRQNHSTPILISISQLGSSKLGVTTGRIKKGGGKVQIKCVSQRLLELSLNSGNIRLLEKINVFFNCCHGNVQRTAI